ncbi:cell division protein FtsA [Bacillaceae bacterium IKA-2]|nr:cell division protein FtsA [Bacillaceae bacterium IKA-2]
MNNRETYVSLDIGTSNVRVIVGDITNGSLNIIGVGNSKSEGIKKGSIVDIDETVRSICRAVEQAEKMIGMSLENVIVGVSGNHAQLQPCHGVVAVSSPDREIGEEDIRRVIDAAQVFSIPPDREIIDVIPKQFIVDGLDEINDPRGMIGVRLEMEGTIITGSKTILHNLLRCVERAGLSIADICLQPLAAGSVAVSKDEKGLGVALVDIGGGSMTVSVFEQGSLQATTVIPIGGDHITNDISVGLRISTEEAERVKVKYGHAQIELASKEEIFKVLKIGSDLKEEFSQYDLSFIIEPRLAEMLQLIDNEVYRLGYEDLPGGYVLTGGGAKIQGLLDLAMEILQNSVRIASPDYIGVREPQYTTGVGLIQFAHKNGKIQGKEVAATLGTVQPAKKTEKKGVSAKKKEVIEGKAVKQKVSKWLKVFFE